MATLGSKLRALREKQKLTQAEMAKLLDVDNTLISRHESDERRPAKEELIKYASVFKMDVIDLLM